MLCQRALVRRNNVVFIAAGTSPAQAFLKKPKSKNYQDSKGEEDDGCNPIRTVRNVCAHGIIPLKACIGCSTFERRCLSHRCNSRVMAITFRSFSRS
jgi:hypothetical protein